jgi:cytochrome c peroxidase
MRAAIVVAVSLAGACASPSTSTTISADEWAELEKLSPAPALPPPPADPSNRVADDPAAAALGQKLFFDPAFSGALLESDNDGQHAGVGLQGETGKVSCASCHLPESGFVDTRTVHGQLSLAAGWTHRRTPSILDVAHAKLLMWDGRFDSLQRQALAVFESPLEANSSRLFFAQQIARNYAEPYRAVFGSDPAVVLDASYPQPEATSAGCSLELTSSTTPDDDCSEGTRSGVPGAADYDALDDARKRAITTIVLDAGKAIAAYERLLSCGPSRFDAFMHGDETALTESEQRGAALFVGKAKCASCHSGPLLSDQLFHNVGMFPKLVSGAFLRKDDAGAEAGFAKVMADPLNVRGEYSDGDDGRLPASIEPAMRGAFRTPMLRCASQRPSFMRDGQLRSLEAVVTFFNEGGHKQPGVPANAVIGYLGETEIEPLGLDEQEVADLVAFLEALDGPGPAPELLTK